jgi:uncharacterized membrane protein (DUF106 family)
MQFLEPLVNPILELIAPRTPPGSSIFIILIATLTTLFSTLVSRKFIDLKKLKLYTKKTKEFQKLQRKVLKSQDPILKKKVENQKATSQRMQSELMKMRMKPLLFTMLPLILIFFSLSSYYSNAANDDKPDSLVGNVPYDLPEHILFFEFGINCNYQRASFIPNQFNKTTPVNTRADLTDAQYINLTGNQQLCINNPSLHYVPTYIGWYIAINVIINSMVTKVTGLTPE